MIVVLMIRLMREIQQDHSFDGGEYIQLDY